MNKVLIFDIGGVLLVQNYRERYAEFARKAGINLKDNEDFWNSRSRLAEGRMSEEEFFSIAVRGKSISVKQAMDIYREAYIKNSPMNIELINLIRKIKRDHKVYALTNTNSFHYTINKQRGLFDVFSKVFTSFDIGAEKPSIKVYRAVIESIGIQPSEGIFIDDQQEYVDAAKESGLHAVLFIDNERLISDLRVLGVRW